MTAKKTSSRRAAPFGFIVLVYRMPPAPTAGRVAVWRQLKKAGAIYLQQSVCIFPDTAEVRAELAPVLAKITASKGEYHLLPLTRLSPDEERKLISQFLDQTARHYQEIVENCEVNFQKEIEFETFRKNFTYEEAEEIRNEYEKIADWFERVKRRDWFKATNRREAESWLRRCRQMLEEFEARVYAQQAHANEVRPRRRSKPTAVSRPRPKVLSTAS
ncbi:MAG TPA: Chromate resistance protein ChrB [Candidatus Limnocylindria bacterium]